MQRFFPRRHLPLLCLPLAAILLSACGSLASKDEDEAKKKNTLDCAVNGQRMLLRFQDKDELRLLMPDGELVYLYSMPTPSGSMRFGNGNTEVRSEGLDLYLIQHRNSNKMDCKPYQIEDEKIRDKDQKKLK